MALKSSREGLRRELVDYLGNLIIDENLKKNIIDSIDSFLRVDLLWTNANPTAEMLPQSISLDLSNYKMITILFLEYYERRNYINYIFIDKINYEEIFYSTGDGAFKRSVNISNNNITFGAGYYVTTTGAVQSISGGLIPVKIYGVR